jgi:hypothetical protein
VAGKQVNPNGLLYIYKRRDASAIKQGMPALVED